MTTVHYIANNKRIKQKLIDYFEYQEVRFRPYDLEKIPNVDILFLANPFKIGDIYYDIHLLWQAYFKIKSPNTKIIVCNMMEDKNCNCTENYLCATSFPFDFKEYLKTIKTVTDLPPIPPINDSIRTQLKSFFQGHHHSSLFQRFNYLQMTIKNIEYARLGEIDRTFQEAKEHLFELADEQLASFENRWIFYQRFFECCPFKKIGKKITENLKTVIEFFNDEDLQTEKEFCNRQIPALIEDIRNLLTEMETYVNLDFE
jgi:hypothetical protein